MLERLLPDEDRPALASSFALLSMAVTGGDERTRPELAFLASGSFGSTQYTAALRDSL